MKGELVMASWIKKYGLALTMALFGKNAQAQEGLAPLPDSNVTPQTEKAVMPSAAKSDSVYVLPARKNVLQTDSVASKYKKRPTFDLSKVDKLGKVWLKTEEGKQALNDYYDALTSVMLEAKMPVLTSDDVGALMAMCKIPAEEKVIGMFPNSTLEYDAEDLLGMKPDYMAEKIDSVSKKYVKPDSWDWGDCARAVKNCMSLAGLTIEADMEKIGSAYQLIDYFRNSENFELRELENPNDVYKIRPGIFTVLDRGETQHGHTFLAIDMGKADEVYVNAYGEAYTFEPVGQRCDKKSENISLKRKNGQKYGAPYVGITKLTQIGDKTFYSELVNEAREEQISKFRSTSIAKENAVPIFESPTPTQLLQRWTRKKAELQTEHNGELSYAEHTPFRWLPKGIYSYRHKKASRGRQGISRTFAQVKKNRRGR